LTDLPYTTADEVLGRAEIKYDALNRETGIPFADENALKTWLTDMVIPEAEKIVNEFCRRSDFQKHEDEVEYFNGDGYRNFIAVTKKPVTAVVKVEFARGDGTWDVTLSSNYYMRGDQIQFKTVLRKGFQNIRVTYDWGYATIPSVVAHLTAEICARFLHKLVAFKMGPLVRVGDYRIQLMNPEIFTPDLKDLLAHYARETAGIG
jgi:hypothetical protein